MVFGSVRLEVEGDAWGFVTGIDPTDHEDVSLASGALSFALSFEGTVAATTGDQYFPLRLNLLGDDRILLGGVDVIVVVPGKGS